MYRLTLIYLLLCLFQTNYSSSQDLNYFTLGEATLKNAEIYSILQTKDLRLFVATNEGLYIYKHGTMKSINPAKEQNGIGLFNLRENKKGEVFCYNLTGQIFRVRKNQLELFAEIPEKELTAGLSMEFDNQDNLIFSSKGCYLITADKIDVLLHGNNTLLYGLSKLPDGRLFISRRRRDGLYEVKDGAMVKRKATFDFENEAPFGLIYTLEGKLTNHNYLNTVYSLKNQDKKYSSNTKYVQFSDHLIWRRRNSTGIETLAYVNNNIEITHQYFNDTFISDIAEGKNGELFLGTFGRGLIVVPNQKVDKHDLKNFGNNIASITSGKDNVLYLADKINGLIKKDGAHIKTITTSFDFIPKKIFYQKNKTLYTPFNQESVIYNSSVGALKNISNVDNQTLLLSSSTGVYKTSNYKILNDSLWTTNDHSGQEYKLKNSSRCNDALYHKEENAIYMASIASLQRLEANGYRETLTFNNQKVVANDLLLYNNQIWAATQNQGLLIFEKGKETIQLNPLLDFVYKIEEKNDIIYISHRSGFQLFDTRNKSWNTIGLPEGIETGTIQDFTISKDYIWFLSNNNLLSLPLEKRDTKEPLFQMSLDSVVISDQLISYFQKNSLSYEKNKLNVYLDFKGLLFEKEAFYTYQLIGFDDKEQTTSVLEPSIRYNYLPPGNYSFSLKTVYRDIETEPILYHFTIEKAFWQTWWFYPLAAIFVIMLVIYYNFVRSKKIEQKNRARLEKQLLKTNSLESELKALRAHMNPHFIFNSLNSIQDLILKQDTDTSYDYIVLFSDLVRNSLLYSEQGFITLAQEIEFLETYLSLEKLRFGEAFLFKIKSEKMDVKLPSLIIQPFVENAVIHGLFHKKGKKELLIDFRKHPSGIQCIIEDNGIGRKKSQEIQKRQGIQKSSYALDAIRKRLEILSTKHKLDIGFTINDIKDKNHLTIGTQAIIILPNLQH